MLESKVIGEVFAIFWIENASFEVLIYTLSFI
jgi:hypothetical protein